MMRQLDYSNDSATKVVHCPMFSIGRRTGATGLWNFHASLSLITMKLWSSNVDGCGGFVAISVAWSGSGND